MGRSGRTAFFKYKHYVDLFFSNKPFKALPQHAIIEDQKVVNKNSLYIHKTF